MTYSQAREYLWKIKRMSMDIKTKKQELQKLNWEKVMLQSFQVAERITTSHENNSNKTIDNIVDLENEIQQEVDSLIDLRRIARRRIEQLKDGRQRDLLLNYYINNETWETTAENLDIGTRWVYRLHKQALQEFCNTTSKPL